MSDHRTSFIDEERIGQTLKGAGWGDATRAREVLAKARELHGLNADDVGILMQVQDAGVVSEMFEAARFVKEMIYGRRIVLFAPLYVSSICRNECSYCAFRVGNRQLKRRALTQDEVRAEAQSLVSQGHKRVLLVAGEGYSAGGFGYVLDCIDSVYAATSGGIRRVNVNVAPLEVEQFRLLKERKIGTYQLFQETYHRSTYASVHLAGQKKDYDYRVTAMDRAMAAGIDDVGIGVLFGLYDWKFELLAMMQHVGHLEEVLVGPHTISVPRLEPAHGSELASQPAHGVSDEDFRRILAILRLAVPYTGIILSTRESAAMRRVALELGVSQISAGSRTDPGGYAGGGQRATAEQFQLGDHRDLDEVVRDLAEMGYVPSFCTACYRMGRTGRDFMELAKPGLIRSHCEPNALSSFQEYLCDFASPGTQLAGRKLMVSQAESLLPAVKPMVGKMLARVTSGERDVCV